MGKELLLIPLAIGLLVLGQRLAKRREGRLATGTTGASTTAARQRVVTTTDTRVPRYALLGEAFLQRTRPATAQRRLRRVVGPGGAAAIGLGTPAPRPRPPGPPPPPPPPPPIVAPVVAEAIPLPADTGLTPAQQLARSGRLYPFRKWWEDLMVKALFIMIVGKSGDGKTFTARALTAGRVARGEKALLMDPHSLKNVEHWGTLAPYCVGAGRNYAEIEAFLKAWLDEITRRYNSTEEFTPLTLVVDEIPSIVEACPSWSKAIQATVFEGRKVGMRAIFMTQSDRVDSLGIKGKGDIREGFAWVRLASKAKQRPCSADAALLERPATLESDSLGPELPIDVTELGPWAAQQITPADLWAPARLPKVAEYEGMAARPLSLWSMGMLHAPDYDGWDAAGPSTPGATTTIPADTTPAPAEGLLTYTGSGGWSAEDIAAAKALINDPDISDRGLGLLVLRTKDGQRIKSWGSSYTPAVTAERERLAPLVRMLRDAGVQGSTPQGPTPQGPEALGHVG